MTRQRSFRPEELRLLSANWRKCTKTLRFMVIFALKDTKKGANPDALQWIILSCEPALVVSATPVLSEAFDGARQEEDAEDALNGGGKFAAF